jgi:hypothetical protein
MQNLTAQGAALRILRAVRFFVKDIDLTETLPAADDFYLELIDTILSSLVFFRYLSAQTAPIPNFWTELTQNRIRRDLVRPRPSVKFPLLAIQRNNLLDLQHCRL